MNKKGFTLIEMLTTTAILVIVFGLLAIIFGRATTIHKVVRSGGDAENLGIYLINTIVYGPGINREKGLVGAKPFTLNTTTQTDTLTFQGQDNQYVRYVLDGSSVKFNTSADGTTWSTLDVDLKPTWATDRQLEVLPESGFYYYTSDLFEAAGFDTAAVGIKLVLKNTLQNIQEAVTLYRCVRVRNQIDF